MGRRKERPAVSTASFCTGSETRSFACVRLPKSSQSLPGVPAIRQVTVEASIRTQKLPRTSSKTYRGGCICWALLHSALNRCSVALQYFLQRRSFLLHTEFSFYHSIEIFSSTIQVE